MFDELAVGSMVVVQRMGSKYLGMVTLCDIMSYEYDYIDVEIVWTFDDVPNFTHKIFSVSSKLVQEATESDIAIAKKEIMEYLQIESVLMFEECDRNDTFLNMISNQLEYMLHYANNAKFLFGISS